MSNYTKLVFVGMLSMLTSACGGSGGADSSEGVLVTTNMDCEFECATSTVAFDGQSVDLFDTPHEDSNSTNATLDVNVRQSGSADNFIFTATTENLSATSSKIQKVVTKIHFGQHFFPTLDYPYYLADPAMIYNYTNNSTPYIWYIEFLVQTNDGEVFEGSAESGETIAARTFLPNEYIGNKISDFRFVLHESNVQDQEADLKYSVSFNFEDDDAIYQFEQVVYAQNSALLANHLPKE